MGLVPPADLRPTWPGAAVRDPTTDSYDTGKYLEASTLLVGTLVPSHRRTAQGRKGRLRTQPVKVIVIVIGIMVIHVLGLIDVGAKLRHVELLASEVHICKIERCCL